MTKKPRSAKQLANDERLRQMAKVRKQTEKIATGPSPSVDNADYQELLDRIKELEKAQIPQTGPQVGKTGLVGTHERFTATPDYYPDPCQRLADEPRLQRFAFRDNYELGWDVGLSQYKTIDGVNTKEPKFMLKLIVKIYDEDTGELTNRRFVILTGIFHEDPDAAIMVARENGLTVDEDNERDFLNEMRYLRFRDWLLEAFYPTPPPPSANKKDMVIGNKLVEVYEVSSDKPESMAKGFSMLTKKL